jgi:hypothetical protein
MRKRSELDVARDGVSAAASFENEMRPAPELPENEPGTRVPDASERTPGTFVSVTWAEEQFQPVQFNTFRVGPFSSTTAVRPGETVAQATVRLHRELDGAASQLRAEKVNAYNDALRRMQGR